MKKIVSTLLTVLLCAWCFAQSTFTSYIIKGDVKLKEKFYEMALNYYKQARAVASDGTETALAEKKIAECNRLMNPEPAEPSKADKAEKAKSKILFTDQYLETGDEFSMAMNEIIYAEEQGEISLYNIEVHQDYIVILSHADGETEEQLEDIPAGTKIPMVSETKEYRKYSSGDDGEFIVFKKAQKNDFGSYHVVLRVDGKQYLKLYSTAEIRQIMKEIQAEEEKEAKEEKAAPEKTAELLPLNFTESWALNLDADGVRLGDTRSEALRAKDVRWLTVRVRYACPEDYAHKVRVDIKITDPSGNLITIPGKGVTKGFSTYEVLDTRPGGGIFTLAFGADDPGSFAPGEYAVSLWHDDVQYYSMIIELQ